MAQATFVDWTTCSHTSGSVGAGTYYPVGFNQTDFFSLCFNIKSFSASLQCSVNENAPKTDKQDAFSNQGTANGTSIILCIASNETQLACPSNSQHKGSGITGQGVTSVIGNYTLPNCLYVNINPSLNIFQSNLYYPYIEISCSQGVWRSWQATPNSKVQFSGSCSFLSKSIPLYCSWQPEKSNLDGYSASVNAQLQITTSSYWTYS
jgi:hypothetical protein